MATYGTTAKHALRYLLGSSNVNEIDDGFAALAGDLDGKLTPYDEGLLSGLPTSTSGTPGKKGRFYRATDDTTGGPQGTLYYDYGTGWIIIPSLGPGAQQAAPAAAASGTVARRVLVPDLAGVSTYTFSGLDGNNDRHYRLGYSGILGLASANRVINVRPNNDTAGFYDSKNHQTDWDSAMQDLSGEYRGAGAGFFIGTGIYGWGGGGSGLYGAAHVLGEAQIEAKVRTGTPRVFRAAWSSSPDAQTERHATGYAGGKWEDMTHNITSLVVHFGGGTFTGDLWLERVFA